MPSVCPVKVASGRVVDDRRSHSFSTGLLSSPEAFYFYFYFFWRGRSRAFGRGWERGLLGTVRKKKKRKWKYRSKMNRCFKNRHLFLFFFSKYHSYNTFTTVYVDRQRRMLLPKALHTLQKKTEKETPSIGAISDIIVRSIPTKILPCYWCTWGRTPNRVSYNSNPLLPTEKLTGSNRKTDISNGKN